MLHNKGVNEYVACARALKERHENLTFLMVGGTDEKNPRAIPSQQLKEWEQQGLVRYLGHREDIIPLLAISNLVVLPSYREGVPRVLLEASAMGKAIVTTDSIGCREVVDHEVNGLRVSQRSVPELVDAVERLSDDEGLRIKYGQAAREKVIREFDEQIVINATIALYDEVLARKSKRAVTAERAR
jgi:glycosyltransferase involved in cell wall biosynthesis